MIKHRPKIYLAAAFRRQAEIRGYAEELRALGFTVTSRWLTEHSESVDKDGRIVKMSIPPVDAAIEDLVDVDEADVLISFTEAPDSNVPPRGGRHVEFGYALARGKELYVIGFRENIFHHVPGVKFKESWTALMADAHSVGGWFA